MSVAFSLLAKGFVGVSAIATSVTFGVIHRDKISSFFAGNKTGSTQDKAENIGKKLGLPEGCDVSKDMTGTKDCQNLNANNLKAINFENKGNGNLTVTDNATAKLKITKESDTTKLPKGLKFTLSTESTTDIEIKNGDNDPRKITFKKSKDQIFKIKENGENYVLEKIWGIEELAEKIGFGSCDTNAKTCSFKEGGKINVLEDSTKEMEASIEKDKNIKYEDNQDNYNQGFKITVNEDIALTAKTGTTATISKLTNNSSTSYEIKFHENNWFLSKKTS